MDDYVLSRPRIRGNTLYHRIEKSFNFCSIELGILFLTISLFYDGTALSLVYFFGAVYFSRKVHLFYKANNRKDPSHRGLRTFYILWKGMIVFMALMLIVKYFFKIWLPSIWNGKYPFDRLTFGCDAHYRNTYSEMSYFKKHSDYFKCIFEWKKWTLLYSRNSYEIIWGFSAFFVMVCSLDNQESLILNALML